MLVKNFNLKPFSHEVFRIEINIFYIYIYIYILTNFRYLILKDSLQVEVFHIYVLKYKYGSLPFTINLKIFGFYVYSTFPKRGK